MLTSADHRHAVITGASRGIGAAIAAELARAGMRLSLLARDEQALAHVCAECGEQAQAFACDVTDEAGVAAALAGARAAHGPVAILVNNAGIAHSAPIERLDSALWTQMLNVNLTGTYLCTRAAIGDMTAAGWGRIINIASTAGRTGYPYVSAYCAAKHGVIGFTRALARELASRGVTVNAVCPGYTETDMLEHAVSSITATTERTPEQARAALRKLNPQGRFVRPDEVASTVAWLCTPGADSVNGQSLVLAGGEVL